MQCDPSQMSSLASRCANYWVIEAWIEADMPNACTCDNAAASMLNLPAVMQLFHEDLQGDGTGAFDLHCFGQLRCELH